MLPRNRSLKHCSDPPPSAPDFATAIAVLPARHRQRPDPPQHLAKQPPVQMPQQYAVALGSKWSGPKNRTIASAKPAIVKFSFCLFRPAFLRGTKLAHKLENSIPWLSLLVGQLNRVLQRGKILLEPVQNRICNLLMTSLIQMPVSRDVHIRCQ